MSQRSILATNEFGLDVQEEVFCQAVAAGSTLKDAHLAAGLAANSQCFSSMSQRTAIRERIQMLLSERLEAAGVTADRTKHEIARIAYFDIRRLFDDRGNLRPIHMLDDDTAAGIAQITVEVKRDPRRRGASEDDEPIETTVVKIKAAPKMEALGLLAKHFKVIGEEGEGVNALANALADRLNSAKRRVHAESIEDAVEVPRRAVTYTPDDEIGVSEEHVRSSDKPGAHSGQPAANAQDEQHLDEDLF